METVSDLKEAYNEAKRDCAELLTFQGHAVDLEFALRALHYCIEKEMNDDDEIDIRNILSRMKQNGRFEQNGKR